MTTIFPLSECLIVVVFIYNNYTSYQDSQSNISIIINSFGIILKVTGHDKGSVSDSPQQQPTFSDYINVSLFLCSYIIIVLQITTLKYMCLSFLITLVSFSNWQVKTEGASATANSNNQHVSVIWTARRLFVHIWPLSFVLKRLNPFVYHQNLISRHRWSDRPYHCVHQL